MAFKFKLNSQRQNSNTGLRPNVIIGMWDQRTLTIGRGKDHCTAGVQFYWFGFYQTKKLCRFWYVVLESILVKLETSSTFPVASIYWWDVLKGNFYPSPIKGSIHRQDKKYFLTIVVIVKCHWRPFTNSEWLKTNKLQSFYVSKVEYI